jgi:hypothetical protein
MSLSPTVPLQSIVRARASDPAAVEWVERAAAAEGVDVFCNGYTAAPKHVGRAPLALTESERAALIAAAPDLRCDRWTVDDAARAFLLLSAAQRLGPEAFVHLAIECYERGDSREQQSWLRGISLLPEADRFTAVAVDACRTNIVPLFEAIACENPYPARHFPERQFNQLVLKALFNSIALARIVGLQTRVNADLSRMARDYAAERRAAARPVPSDISMAMIDDPSQELAR